MTELDGEFPQLHFVDEDADNVLADEMWHAMHQRRRWQQQQQQQSSLHT